MAKVGILTFHLSQNYGSCLQAWALKRAIEKLGHSAEIIHYQQRNYEKLYGKILLPTDRAAIRHDILYLARMPYFRMRDRDFREYRETLLGIHGREIKSAEDLRAQCEEYDTVICGSDQIWNPDARDYDTNYLLPGIKGIRKTAYAVSLNNGSFDGKERADEMRKWLKDFYAISTREKNGAEKIKAFLGGERDIDVMPDPTLRIDRSEWKAAEGESFPREPYLFYYSVKQTNTSIRAAMAAARRLRIPIYTMISGVGKKTLLREGRAFRLPKEKAGPMDFAAFIDNAAYVITDSFHGVAMSTILEKDFIVPTDTASPQKRGDPRITEFMETMGLTDRSSEPDQIPDRIQTKADYTEAEKALTSLQRQAAGFLKRGITG